MSSTGQLVQAGGEAGPVGLHGGEELAVGHVVNRDPADFHAFVVVCLGLDGVAGLFEGKHGGVGPRAVVLAVGADYLDVFGSDVGFLIAFAQRALDGRFAVRGGTARGYPTCRLRRSTRRDVA